MNKVVVVMILGLAGALIGCRSDDANVDPRDPMDVLATPPKLDPIGGQRPGDVKVYVVVTTLHQTDTETGVGFDKIIAKDKDGYFHAVLQPAGAAQIPNGTKVSLYAYSYTYAGGENYIRFGPEIFVPVK